MQLLVTREMPYGKHKVMLEMDHNGPKYLLAPSRRPSS